MTPARSPSSTTRAVALFLGLVAVLATTPIDASDCARWRAAFARMPSGTLTLAAGERMLRIAVKVAEDDEQRAAGFQCATRDEIQQTRVLFDFGGEIVTAFHMQNVIAPLDIAFAKADGRIFAIQRMTPSPTAVYQPMGAFRYAVEAAAGFFEHEGIRPGEARLVTPGRMPGR